MKKFDITRYTSRSYSGHREFWSAQQALDRDRVKCFDQPAHVVQSESTGLKLFSSESMRALGKLSGQDPTAQLTVCLTALARVLLSHGFGSSMAFSTPPLARAQAGPDLQLPLILPAFEEESIKEALIKVSQTLSSAYTYQDYPVRYFFPAIADAEIGIYRADLHAHRPTSPVVIEFVSDGYKVTVSSSPEDLNRIERVMQQVDHVLAGFSETDKKIASLSVLSPSQAKQADEIGSGNRAIPLDAQPQSIWHLFHEHYSKSPSATALTGPGFKLSYTQLLERSLVIADALKAHGIDYGDLVALTCDRSQHWIECMLAIFSMGAIYVPVSPDHPAHRIQSILTDASVTLLIDTTGSLSVDAIDCRVLGIDQLGMKTTTDKRPAADRALFTVGRSDVAYVLYTSGSTGKPKGVQIRHGGFVNMVLDQIRQFDVTPSDVVFQMAAGTFDASLSEIFMALGSGATLRLAAAEVLQDMDQLENEFTRNGVTVVTLTPGHLTALEGRKLNSLKTLIVAGDVTHYSQVSSYLKTASVFNAYGPTETSVCATIHPVSDKDSGLPLPIGRTIANSHIYVVDRYSHPLPEGMIGQIVFTGTGVAAGYLGLESSAFLNAFGHDNEPAYLTGDLGRFRSDGTIEFFGRKDRQLKIRGYRIESAEVEQAIVSFPYARQVHVNRTLNNELAAWVAFEPAVELWPSIAEFYVYDDLVYGSMASDHQRNASYMAAFRRKLPGKVVLEIGPGPFAVLSRMAIEAGAAKVYAVELSPTVAEQARQEIKRHGLQDQIFVIQGDIRQVTLPEQVDCCISEIVGSIGGSEGSAVLINESRKFLKEPINQIPAKSITKLYGVELRPMDALLGFSPAAQKYTRAIFDQVGSPFDLRLCLKNLPSSSILTSDGVLEDLDYRYQIEPETTHDTSLRVKTQGWIDGLIASLNLVTDADHPEETIDILTSTGSWLPVYFPLGKDAFMVQAGDEIRIRVRRTLHHNKLNPDFQMDGRLIRSGREVGCFSCFAPHVANAFRSDAFYQQLFDQQANPRPLMSSIEAMRSFLKDRLPDYMLPERVMEIDVIPLNASGKVDYSALPQPQIHSIDQTKPRNTSEDALVRMTAQVLGLKDVGIFDDFFSLGGDSIRAIQLSARLAEQGWALSSTSILQHRVIAEIAIRMSQKKPSSRRESTRTGMYPLTPIQHWFMTQPGNKNHFNQSLMLERTGPIDAFHLQTVLTRLVNHHDVLRSRFVGLEASIGDEVSTFEVTEVSLDGDQLTSFCDGFQASLNVESGVIFKAALIDTGNVSLLLLVAHHLVVDWVSWRVLTEDFVALYDADQQLSATPLPERTDSFIDWAHALKRQPLPWTPEEKSHWDHLISAQSVHWVDPNPGVVKHAASVSSALSVDDTACLTGRANEAYNTDVVDLLAAALAVLSVRRNCPGLIKIWLERHGRDYPIQDVNVSRTVGWFTSFFPVELKADAQRDIDFHIKVSKDSLRSVPSGGFGYLHHCAGADPQVHVGLNYLGHLDHASQGHEVSSTEKGWIVSNRSAGKAIDPERKRMACLDILANISDGQLHVVLQFNADRVQKLSAQTLLDEYLSALREVISHCSTRQVSITTASDLTYQGLDEDALDSIFSNDK